ncbi:MAG: cupin domain-containing protein [Pseudomonadota bacterium]
MPKVDQANAPVLTQCGYPAPYAEHCSGRSRIRLGDLGGLTQFGVNLTRLAPGAASAHQHWHETEDEFVLMLEGEAVLVEDDGETVLRAGDAATFKAGVPNGHMLVNRSEQEAVFIEVGTRSSADTARYTDPDVDMLMIKTDGNWVAHRKNGEPY